MPNKNVADHSDFSSGAMPKQQRQRTVTCLDENETKGLTKKLRDVEIRVPIVYGNVAFWLGKKASEHVSHKWAIYVRSAKNEDLGSIIKRAVFQLHPSFKNPSRIVNGAPFVLSESGWGEFEIVITLYFHDDVSDKTLQLYHNLKLYPEAETGPLSTKKPVVTESYDEILLSEPSEALFARVQNHPAVIVPSLPAGVTLPIVPMEDLDSRKKGDTKDHPLNQWFTNFSDANEILVLAAARQQVQAHISRLERQLSSIDGKHQQSKAASDM